MSKEFDNWPAEIHPANYTMKTNPVKAEARITAAEPLSIDLADMSADEAAAQIGALVPLATASIETILRNPQKYPSQAVAAAKLVYERKLGAIPDTVIQNNTQIIVKWQD